MKCWREREMKLDKIIVVGWLICWLIVFFIIQLFNPFTFLEAITNLNMGIVFSIIWGFLIGGLSK